MNGEDLNQSNYYSMINLKIDIRKLGEKNAKNSNTHCSNCYSIYRILYRYMDSAIIFNYQFLGVLSDLSLMFILLVTGIFPASVD